MKKCYIWNSIINISISSMIFVFLCASLLFTVCENPAIGSIPQEQTGMLNVSPGNCSLNVSWDNFPGGTVLAGTYDEMPSESAGTVTVNGNSAIITGLTNNVAYNVWVIGDGGKYLKTGEKAVPVKINVPAGKFAGSEYIYELDGVTYTKYKNGGAGNISDIIYSGTVIFVDSDGVMIIKTTKTGAGFSNMLGSYNTVNGTYIAVKVTYTNKLYKVKESTETPEVPANETGKITASFGDEYTANIVVGNLVTFDNNGAEIEAVPPAIVVNSGKTAVRLPVPPTKTNFQFVSWKKTDGSEFTAETTVDSDITVYAQWMAETGGVRTFISMGDMASYLENFSGPNNAENPVEIVLTDAVSVSDMANGNDCLGLLFETLNGRYVALDMSAVTGDTIADALEQIGNFREYKNFLVSVKLPAGLEKIGSYAFTNCASLESVVIPDTLKNLGKGAFSGCAVLNTLTLPDTVTEILDKTFEGCASLNFDAAFFANIEKIGPSAFKGSGITSFTLLQKVTQLGPNAFENCTKLETVNLSALSTSSLTDVGVCNFKNCSKLKNLILPSTGITTIGRETFYGCSELVSVTLPTTLEGNNAIGQSTFESCTKLETVVWLLAKNPSRIGASKTFKGCVSLQTFTVPEGVTVLHNLATNGNSPFDGCVNLTRITLPSSLTTIPAYTISNAERLVEINILKPSASTFNGTALLNVNAFTGTPIGNKDANAHIYVPDETSAAAYKSVATWSNFTDLISVKP